MYDNHNIAIIIVILIIDCCRFWYNLNINHVVLNATMNEYQTKFVIRYIIIMSKNTLKVYSSLIRYKTNCQLVKNICNKNAN